jgi:hypothetical protein
MTVILEQSNCGSATEQTNCSYTFHLLPDAPLDAFQKKENIELFSKWGLRGFGKENTQEEQRVPDMVVYRFRYEEKVESDEEFDRLVEGFFKWE